MMPKFNLHAGIFSLKLKATGFLFFVFTAITLIINARALYGNVFVASLIYRPPSLVPILTALQKYTQSSQLSYSCNGAVNLDSFSMGYHCTQICVYNYSFQENWTQCATTVQLKQNNRTHAYLPGLFIINCSIHNFFGINSRLFITSKNQCNL